MRPSVVLLLGLLTGLGGCERPAQRFEIEIRDLTFGPKRLDVTVGDSLVWVNHDLFPHTATADGAAGWDTGSIPASESRGAVARRPGTYDYFCRVHPTMHGRVVVHEE